MRASAFALVLAVRPRLGCALADDLATAAAALCASFALRVTAPWPILAGALLGLVPW